MSSTCSTRLPMPPAKPCRFLFIHIESIVDRQSASGTEALSKPMAYPQVGEFIQYCFQQQQRDTSYQWRVIFYTSFPESKRRQVIQWLNDQMIWGSEALLTMRDPLRHSHVSWTTTMVHELSAMLGANNGLLDRCLLFDQTDTTRGGKTFQGSFNQYLAEDGYANVLVCSTLKELSEAMKAWR